MTKEEIKIICRIYNITNYIINKDGSIDVNDDVNLSWKHLRVLPLRFGTVTGNFNCALNKLTSLEGCPETVFGMFFCYDNKLTTLKYCPKKVTGIFDCSHNALTTLEGCPNEVGESFNCSHNELISLKGCPDEIKGNFDCSDNDLESLEGCPKKITQYGPAAGNFNCEHNNLKSLEHGPKIVSGEYIASSNNITDFSGFPENYQNENYVNFACNPVFEILDLVSLEHQTKFINHVNHYDSIIKKGNIIFEVGLDQAYYEATKEELAFERKEFRNYTLI